MEFRYRLRSGVRVTRTDGLRVLRRDDEIALPAALGTPLAGALLDALRAPHDAESLARRLGVSVAPLLPVLERLEVVERLAPAGTPVRLVGHVDGLQQMLEADGFTISDRSALVVSLTDDDVEDDQVLHCRAWVNGLGAVGPRGRCARCWTARLASHGYTRIDGGDVLSDSDRRLFTALVIREVSAMAAGRDDALAPGTWRALRYADGHISTRTFSGLPGCPWCASSSDGLVDRYSGVFADIEIGPLETRRVPLFAAVGRLGDTRALGRGEGFRGSGGVAPSPLAARGKALGEGLERYCATLPANFNPIVSSWADLDRPALDPRSLALFSDEQYDRPGFPYRPATAEMPLRWVEGRRLPDDDPLWIPAACVYMPYEVDETPLLPAHSHGLACGQTLREAVTAGLLELVERDAFMQFWQRAAPAPRLSGLDKLRGTVRGLLDEIDERGWDLDVLDLAGDLAVPVMLAVAWPKAGPRLVMGAAADTDPERALTRALLELMQNHRWLARELVRRVAMDGPPRTFEEHALHYSWHPEHLAALTFLRQGPTVDFQSLPPLSGSVDACLVRHGSSCAYVDLTTADAPGQHVVRAIVPQLVRVHDDEDFAFLGSPRLGECRNPWPHPFP